MPTISSQLMKTKKSDYAFGIAHSVSLYASLAYMQSSASKTGITA